MGEASGRRGRLRQHAGPSAELRACVEGPARDRAPWTPVDELDIEPEVEGPRATLDAVRAPDDGGGNDFFGLGGTDLRATVKPRDYGMTADAETAAADEPRGAALLEAGDPTSFERPQSRRRPRSNGR